MKQRVIQRHYHLFCATIPEFSVLSRSERMKKSWAVSGPQVFPFRIMLMDSEHTSQISQANEEAVHQYFEKKGWSSLKLDRPKHSAVTACDWLFQNNDIQLLCEVKTVTSVRKGTDTEAHFSRFVETLRNHFLRSDLSKSSLKITIHSDDVYQPSHSQTKGFIDWLERSIRTLMTQRQPYGWTYDATPWGDRIYTCQYIFEDPSGKNTPGLSVNIFTGNVGELEISPHVYGDFHIRKIDDAVTVACTQLKKTAQRQSNPSIARVVVLAFEGSSGGGIDFDWLSVYSRVSEVLKENQTLSAIAIISLVSLGKYAGSNIIDSIVDSILSPATHRFVVLHNKWRTADVDPLDTSAFLDDYSCQLSLL